jgi:hypothetical protein
MDCQLPARRSLRRIGTLAMLAGLAGLAGSPGISRAAANPPSGSIDVYTAGPAVAVLRDVECPSASQCTAVDDAQAVVTFDPLAPSPTVPSVIDPSSQLVGLVCPSVAECVAIDSVGGERMFNPAAPGSPKPLTIDYTQLFGLACPATNQCTVIDGSGNQVTFDPTTSIRQSPITVDPGQTLKSIACASTTQCAAIDNHGGETTFDPTVPGAEVFTTIDGVESIISVACPSTSQCTAIDGKATELTFDPAAPGTPTPVAIDSRGIFAELYATNYLLVEVACPSLSECAAVDTEGNVSTFDPQAPGPRDLTPLPGVAGLIGVACPTTVECVGLDIDGPEVTFDPANPSTDSVTAVGTAPVAPARASGCTAARSCVTSRTTGARVGVTCSGNIGAQCGLALTLSLVDQARPPEDRRLRLGSATAVLTWGEREVIPVALTAAGRRLLATDGRLRLELKIAESGGAGPRTTVFARQITIHAARRSAG